MSKIWHTFRASYLFIFFLLYLFLYRLAIFQVQFVPEDFLYAIKVFFSGILFDISFILLISLCLRNLYTKYFFYILGVIFLFLNLINLSHSHFYKGGLISFTYLFSYLSEAPMLIQSGKNLIPEWSIFIFLILPLIIFFLFGLRLYGQIKTQKTTLKHKIYNKYTISLLATTCFIVASYLEFSPSSILSSNIVYRMIYHETRTYLQFSNYLSILKNNQTNKLYYPDQAHFESQKNQFISKKYLAVKTPPKISHQPKIKPNLVLIIMESLAAKDTGLQDSITTQGTNVTPFLNTLISKSVVFSPFFSNADYTAGAEVAIFCSTHDSLRYSIANGSILRDLTNTQLLCLPKILADVGYSTSFFHSYTTTFDNKHIFFPLNGVQEIIDRDDSAFNKLKRVSFGLISDEKLFLYGVKYLNQSKQPFFASFLTVDNHQPFVMHEPSKKKYFTKRKKYNDYLNTVKQTDDALRSFFREASKQDWYKNTIFIITSDNGIFLSENKTNEMKWEYFFKAWHLIPFLIYSPSKRANLKSRMIHLPSASHIDVTPTILDILGISITNPFVGESLFSTKRRNYTLVYDWFNNYYRLSWPYLYHNTDNQMYNLIYEKKISSPKLSEYHKWVEKSYHFFNYLIYTDQIWTGPLRKK